MTPKELEEARNALHYGISRSIAYHDRRTAFLDSVHKSGRFLTLLFSFTAVGALLKTWQPLAMIAALISAFFSTLELAFSISERARNHYLLKQRFVELDRKICLIGLTNLTEDNINAFRAERLVIEHDEPPTFYWLDSICYNAYCRAEGLNDKVIEIAWYKKCLANILHGSPCT